MVVFDAFGYALRDQRWITKSIVTTLTYFLIFPPMGYATLIAQKVSRGDEKGLPEHELGYELVSGIGITLAWAVYQIPTYFIYRLLGGQVSLSLGGLVNLNSAASAGSGVFIAVLLLTQVFGFIFWVAFVLWASTGKVSSFFNLVKINDTILAHYDRLIPNYIQLFVGLILWYIFVMLTTITICLPFVFLAFYLFIYGYITGKTARDLGLRAAAPGELTDFTGDF